MIIAYITIAALILAGMLGTAGKIKEFKNQTFKKHPLKIFYPLSAYLCGLGERLFGKKETKAAGVIKKLNVKENADAEIRIYRIKKCSIAIGIILASCIVGIIACLPGRTSPKVSKLERNDYGYGNRSYTLDVDYKDISETIELEIEQKKYTEEEILEIFDEAYDQVIRKMLNGNESQESVSKPLNLISKYGGISISWEIEDTDALDYNGNIKYEFGEDEMRLVNLYATFRMDGVTEEYTVPLVLKAAALGEVELLIENIKECIEESNDVHEIEVELPDNINGEKVSFSQRPSVNQWTYLALAVLAVLAAMIALERGLEERLKKRQEEMMLDYTEIVSKLSLLHDAGLSIYKAWERIVSEYEARGERRFAYQEMKLALEKIKSGAGEGESYRQFGKRCGLHQYIKLGNLLEQNLTKGTKGMKELLAQEVAEAFEERKRLARKKGEEASTKMLIPMIMMLAVVIVIVAVPALMSIGI